MRNKDKETDRDEDWDAKYDDAIAERLNMIDRSK